MGWVGDVSLPRVVVLVRLFPPSLGRTLAPCRGGTSLLLMLLKLGSLGEEAAPGVIILTCHHPEGPILAGTGDEEPRIQNPESLDHAVCDEGQECVWDLGQLPLSS